MSMKRSIQKTNIRPNYTYSSELYHYGTKGQKWGVRRYQNPDGSLTAAGKLHYAQTSARAVGYLIGVGSANYAKDYYKALYKKANKEAKRTSSSKEEYRALKNKNRDKYERNLHRAGRERKKALINLANKDDKERLNKAIKLTESYRNRAIKEIPHYRAKKVAAFIAKKALRYVPIGEIGIAITGGTGITGHVSSVLGRNVFNARIKNVIKATKNLRKTRKITGYDVYRTGRRIVNTVSGRKRRND